MRPVVGHLCPEPEGRQGGAAIQPGSADHARASDRADYAGARSGYAAAMARRDDDPELHRGDRPRARRDQGVRAAPPAMSLTEVATAAGLARPDRPPDPADAERAGLRARDGRRLRPHPAGARARHGLRAVAWGCGTWRARTWSSWSRAPASRRSIAQLDGSDIVYVARVAVPKIVALAVQHRHPVPGAARPRSARSCSPA